jgi:crossover junction endodeoxyribonuclease RusA
VIVLRMPWDSPPLRSNDRMHWAKKAKLTKQVRQDAWVVASATQYDTPRRPVVVSLVWEVTDKRRRDVGAAGPTLKACVDGFVDAALLSGDHHVIVTEERLRIEVGTRRGVRIEIQEVRDGVR